MKSPALSTVGAGPVGESIAWYRSTLALGLAGSLLLWAALPPLALGPLAWIAPVPWLLLVRGDKLSGLRPYGALWLAAFVFWLIAIHWLRLPHPAVYLGWLALSAYLACYLPVFVGLSRVAAHRLRAPLWLAAPVVWTGLELARAHIMTGFLMGSLAHTQVRFTTLIQVSDLAGEYTVDFVVMTVAACVTLVFFPPRRLTAIMPASIVLAASLSYGHLQLRDVAISDSPLPTPQSIRVALIQGNSLADWKFDSERQRQIMDNYVALSHKAVEKARELDGRPIDLVVWPETMFRGGLTTIEPGYQLPPHLPFTTDELLDSSPRNLARLVEVLGVPVLVGIDRVHFNPPPAGTDPSKEEWIDVVTHARNYNSAVLVDRGGKIVGTYDKVHLVMFGEYVPFAKWLPLPKWMASITGTADAGVGPEALCVGDVCFAPNICYETAMPHVIRNQVATLGGHGKSPDVLVNLTNDAWYWGSSELDMHLACDVFRAVETRKPLVIAANGGISAWIDAFGRVRAQSPRQTDDVIIADIERGPFSSYYVEFGDWFAGACLACCVALALVGWTSRR